MNHTNKMILVPHEIVGDNESVIKYLSDLDKEMLSIVNDKSIPIDAKILKYNQILRMFQTAKRDVEKPIKIEVQDEYNVKQTPTDAPETKQETKIDTLQQAIVKTVPPKWHKQANMLLEYARKAPNMALSSKGELIIDGNKIVGSNIIDIINDLSRTRTSEPAIGVDVFLKRMADENMPKELIVNKRRYSLIDQDVYASPAVQLSQNNAKQSPTTTPSPKRSITQALTDTYKNWTGITR